MLYVEEVSREALGLVRPGETVILTVPDNTAVSLDPSKAKAQLVASTSPNKKPSWQSWFGFFFGNNT